MPTLVATAAMILMALPAAADAQSLMDRSPNVPGAWVTRPGTVQFNFLHRFVASSTPDAKVTNFPTFLVAIGLPAHLMAGFQYATNSTLAERYPNEWEFFARAQLLRQDQGRLFDVTAQAGYNLAAQGADAELAIGRRFGALRLTGVGRVLSSPYIKGERQYVVGGGANVRLNRHLSLAGDVTTLSSLDTARAEKPAWSAGLHIAIPNTPHTLSLQVTNTNTATMQGSSRGGRTRRYGFEFTIPLTLSRYFGRRPTPAAAAAPAAGAASAPAIGTTTTPPGAKPRKSGMRNLAFADAVLEVQVGETITWTNNDAMPHSVTSAAGLFDSGLLDGGSSWSFTFTKAGTYDYICTPHPFMKGQIIVKEAVK